MQKGTGIHYHVATVDELWEYANRPQWNRISLETRKQCAQQDCENIVTQHSDYKYDEEKGETVKFPREHYDVSWSTVEEAEEKEIRVDFLGDWKHEREGYEVNDKKELRRTRDSMVIEFVKVTKRVRSSEKVMRLPERLICTSCRDVIYCSEACAKVDAERHAAVCSKNPPDILKCVINEDNKGVEDVLITQGNTEALRFFAGHSLYEYAEALHTPDILSTLQSALNNVSYAACMCYAIGDKAHGIELLERVFKTLAVPSLEVSPCLEKMIFTEFKERYQQAQKDKAQRIHELNKRFEFQCAIRAREEMDVDGLGDLYLSEKDVQEAILNQDTERYDHIHELRPELIDYKRDVEFADSDEFMREWLLADLQTGLDACVTLMEKGRPMSEEWEVRRQWKEEAATHLGMPTVDLLAGMTKEELAEEERQKFEPTIPSLIDADSVDKQTGEELDDLPQLVAAC